MNQKKESAVALEAVYTIIDSLGNLAQTKEDVVDEYVDLRENEIKKIYAFVKKLEKKGL